MHDVAAAYLRILADEARPHTHAAPGGGPRRVGDAVRTYGDVR
jgi:hypothetical protein